MTGLKMLHRHVQEVPADKWKEMLALEREIDAVEMELGYPVPRRYRSLFSAEHTQTVRVQNRLYDSMGDFGRKLEERARNKKLQELDAKRRSLIKWEREELFFVDSGSPVPRWMQAVSRKPMTEEEIRETDPFYEQPWPTAEEIQENQKTGRVRILYRHIQEVPKDRWAEKLEQERISDAAERQHGDPLPMRYRAMYGTENSHTRINEREYPDYVAFCKGTEAFFEDNTPADKAVMDAEVRRQEFFNWEREEIYIVDFDSYNPKWMDYAAQK